MRKPRISVAIISCVLIVSGLAGLAYHAREFRHSAHLFSEILWISLVRLLAVLAGIFMLFGNNWARWLAMAWIGAHVIISVFHSPVQLLLHVVVFAVFAFFLFRRPAREYFGQGGQNPLKQS